MSAQRISIPLSKLARVYEVAERQARRWHDAGIDLEDPAAVALALSSQDRPGNTLMRLSAPGAIERTRESIRELRRVEAARKFSL